MALAPNCLAVQKSAMKRFSVDFDVDLGTETLSGKHLGTQFEQT